MANDENLEEVFRLIEKGNDSDGEKKHWEAAKFFSDAMTSLFRLALNMKTTDEEEQRIEELYRTQCREYLHRARKALIGALVNEDATDQSDKNVDPKFISMTEQEASNRVQLFSTLFSKELDTEVKDSKNMDDEQDQQLSLEARLESLNESLPSRFKSNTERMQEINQSLKGLGVNTYSHADSEPEIHIPASTEEQVNDIIAQAQDEARVEALNKRSMMSSNEEDDDIVLTDEESSSLEENDEDDASNSIEDKAKLLNKKSIRKSVINAQVKLAQLLAMIDGDSGGTEQNKSRKNGNKNDTQNSKKDRERNDDEEEGKLSDDDSTTTAKDELELEQGRVLLLKAKKNLNNAVEAWEIET